MHNHAITRRVSLREVERPRSPRRATGVPTVETRAGAAASPARTHEHFDELTRAAVAMRYYTIQRHKHTMSLSRREPGYLVPDQVRCEVVVQAGCRCKLYTQS